MSKIKNELVIDEDLNDDITTTTDIVIDEDAPVATVKITDIVDEDADTSDALPDHAILNDDGSVTLPLHYPVSLKIKKGDKVRDEVYSELVFYRFTGADQMAINGTSDKSRNMVMFSRSTRIREQLMKPIYDRMDASDITAGGQVMITFFTSGRKTGQR